MFSAWRQLTFLATWSWSGTLSDFLYFAWLLSLCYTFAKQANEAPLALLQRFHFTNWRLMFRAIRSPLAQALHLVSSQAGSCNSTSGIRYQTPLMRVTNLLDPLLVEWQMTTLSEGRRWLACDLYKGRKGCRSVFLNLGYTMASSKWALEIPKPVSQPQWFWFYWCGCGLCFGMFLKPPLWFSHAAEFGNLFLFPTSHDQSCLLSGNSFWLFKPPLQASNPCIIPGQPISREACWENMPF